VVVYKEDEICEKGDMEDERLVEIVSPWEEKVEELLSMMANALLNSTMNDHD